jgi:hypothetical protein
MSFWDWWFRKARTSIYPHVYQGTLNVSKNQMKDIAGCCHAVVTASGPGHVDKLRRINSRIVVLRYINAVGLHNSDPLYSLVDKNGGFWDTSDKRPVVCDGYGWRLGDIRQPEWVAELLRCNPVDGYDGIMLDEMKTLDHGRFSGVPENYDESEYYESLREILCAARSEYSSALVAFNGYKHSRTVGQPFSGLDLPADVISFEGFVYGIGGSFPARRVCWHIRDAQKALADGRIIAINDYGNQGDYQNQFISLCVYLLLSSDRTHWNFNASDDIPEAPYQIQTGMPLESCREVSQELFVRKFGDGEVVVNMSDGDRNVALKNSGVIASWRQKSANIKYDKVPAGTLTMPAFSASMNY